MGEWLQQSLFCPNVCGKRDSWLQISRESNSHDVLRARPCQVGRNAPTKSRSRSRRRSSVGCGGVGKRNSVRSDVLNRGETQFVAGGQAIDELRTMISNCAVGELKVKLPSLDPAAKIGDRPRTTSANLFYLLESKRGSPWSHAQEQSDSHRH